MEILATILFAIGVTLNNFALAYYIGRARTRINAINNFLIIIITIISVFIAYLIGSIAFILIPSDIVLFVAAVIVLLVGIWWVTKALLNILDYIPCQTCDTDNCYPRRISECLFSTYSFREFVILLFVIFFSDFLLAFALGVFGIDLILLLIVTLIVSVLAALIIIALNTCYMCRKQIRAMMFIAGFVIIALGVVLLLMPSISVIFIP